jgi:hypothetical protein
MGNIAEITGRGALSLISEQGGCIHFKPVRACVGMSTTRYIHPELVMPLILLTVIESISIYDTHHVSELGLNHSFDGRRTRARV